ncbi:hypothetical protein [Promicromonospora sp. NPDC023987]|uniref:hypothetical protein n=1 Tax=Promicromonospora sp. NPDC023987 TaxID=3155360 RepID=UPI0033CEB9B1
MIPSARVVLPAPSSLEGLTDHCTPDQARRLQRPILQTIISATWPLVLAALLLIVATFVYSAEWPTAIVLGVVYSMLVAALYTRIVQTAVPVRPQRPHPRRATYVLEGGSAVIGASITDRAQGLVELVNHAKVPGTSPDTVRAMRRTVITAILHANPLVTLRITTRVPALARLYALDFDACAEMLDLNQRSVTRPVRLRQRVTGLRTEVLLLPSEQSRATERRR